MNNPSAKIIRCVNAPKETNITIIAYLPTLTQKVNCRAGSDAEQKRKFKSALNNVQCQAENWLYPWGTINNYVDNEQGL